MIKQNNNEIVALHINGHDIKAIYMRGRLIWALKEESSEILDILSCFNNGYWIDEYPWTDETPWTD